MKSLVRCILCPKIEFKDGKLMVDDVFGVNVVADFRVDAPPQEVLNATLFNYKLDEYLGVAPWVLVCWGNKRYLDISELDGLRTDGGVEDFLKCGDFNGAKRKKPLDEQQARSLADKILYNLSEENYSGIFVSRAHNADIVYAHVLSALGRETNSSQVSEMLLKQVERRQREQIGNQEWDFLSA